jgi:Flp pilus assembly protein TadD
MTNHNRESFTNWPISKGDDISWWKNIANASSYFAEDIGSFFGGYNHNQEAGTAFVGNKHLMIGKKFWSWGASPSGRLWDWVLSDGGGPYVEPQAGFYTDNQPDFHWLNPGEIRDFSLYFFPVKGIGAFKKANINGALNLEFNNDSIQMGVYSTSKITNGIVRLSYQNEIVDERIISIDPSASYLQTIPYSKKEKNNFNLAFLDASGKILISYSPTPENNSELPEPVEPIKSASNYVHKDEIWNHGEYMYRNRDKSRAGEFFNILLKDDSLDVRANISLAQMSIEKADYEKALHLLNNAHSRNRDNGKLYYLRGVANLYLGKPDDAYNAFYRATHYLEFVASGYQQIAQLDLKNGDVASAEIHIEKALERNAKSPDLLTLKAICERLKQNYTEAEAACSLALEFDPMNLCALKEIIKILELRREPAFEEQKLLKQLLIDDYHYYIQLSLFYIKIGLYHEALQALHLFPKTKLQEKTLVDYYKGYCYDRLNDKNNAEQSFANARMNSIDKILPFRKYSIDILKTALKFNALDFNANYLLGLTYAGLLNGENAYRYLLKASEINPNQAKVWRNLGYLKYGYPGISRDLPLARGYYQKAFMLAPGDDLILMEFDKVKMDLKEDPLERLNFLKQYTPIVETNDNLLATMLDLMVVYEEYEKPLKYYAEHFFNNREGKYGIHNSYMNAYIGLAQKEKNPDKALAFYKKACEYPDNLKVKPRNPNLRGFLYYPMALLYRKTGNITEAKRLLQITAREHTVIPTIANYYQAQAARELKSENSEYSQLIADLASEGTALINGKNDGYIGKDEDFLKALGYYYLSLSHRFTGEEKLAESKLKQAKNILLTIERDAIELAQAKYK